MCRASRVYVFFCWKSDILTAFLEEHLFINIEIIAWFAETSLEFSGTKFILRVLNSVIISFLNVVDDNSDKNDEGINKETNPLLLSELKTSSSKNNLYKFI